jgi:hypothetical protein
MHFNVKISTSKPDVDAIEEAIREVDPSALVDIDPTGQTLRVAASIPASQLLELMGDAGYPVMEERLERVPSECCGGCGG